MPLVQLRNVSRGLANGEAVVVFGGLNVHAHRLVAEMRAINARRRISLYHGREQSKVTGHRDATERTPIGLLSDCWTGPVIPAVQTHHTISFFQIPCPRSVVQGTTCTLGEASRLQTRPRRLDIRDLVEERDSVLDKCLYLGRQQGSRVISESDLNRPIDDLEVLQDRNELA